MSDEKDLNQGSDETKAEVKESVDLKKRLKGFYNDHMAEFKKIIWPSRPELLKQTVTVIIISLVFGAYITGLDAILAAAFHQFVKFLG